MEQATTGTHRPSLLQKVEERGQIRHPIQIASNCKLRYQIATMILRHSHAAELSRSRSSGVVVVENYLRKLESRVYQSFFKPRV